MAIKSQNEMEMNMASGGAKGLNINTKGRLEALARSKTGDSATHDKAGGKKTIDIGKKMAKVMRAKGMIK